MRRLGIDVTTSTDAGLLGAADGEQLAYGLAQGRLIFTEDDDFLALAAAGVEHAGLAYCRQNTRSIGQIVHALELVWEVYELDNSPPAGEIVKADGKPLATASCTTSSQRNSAAVVWPSGRTVSMRPRVLPHTSLRRQLGRVASGVGTAHQHN